MAFIPSPKEKGIWKAKNAVGLAVLFTFNGLLIASAVQMLVQGTYSPTLKSGFQVISGEVSPGHCLLIDIRPWDNSPENISFYIVFPSLNRSHDTILQLVVFSTEDPSEYYPEDGESDSNHFRTNGWTFQATNLPGDRTVEYVLTLDPTSLSDYCVLINDSPFYNLNLARVGLISALFGPAVSITLVEVSLKKHVKSRRMDSNDTFLSVMGWLGIACEAIIIVMSAMRLIPINFP